MRHRADEFAGGIAWQPGIGVQREDVANRGEERRIADDLGERSGRTAAEQRVELLQLAAFAFVAHPEALVRIPNAWPMEQTEDRRAVEAVPRIQGPDALAHQSQQVRVVGLHRLGRITKISQQREKEVRIAVPQVADLQAFQQIGDGLRTGQERGDDHHRATVRRNPFRKIKSRQQARADHDIRQQVHQRDRHLRCGNHSQRDQHPDAPVIPAERGDLFQHDAGRSHRDHQQRADITENRESANRTAEGAMERPASVDDAFQLRSTFVVEIESHVGSARRRAVAKGRFPRESEGGVGHCVLGDPGLPRHGFNAVAITVARDEIHPGIHACGIGTQRPLDDAHRLDELPPVHHAQEAQTADAIADGNLIDRLGLVVHPLQLLAGQALFGKTVLDPALNGRQRRTLSLQPSAEFLYELVAERRLGLGHVRQHTEDAFRLFLHRRQQAAGPQVGQIPISSPPGNVHRHAPQVLDQPQTQHDRHGPQFAERQRGDRLVGGDEVADVFRVHAAIRVGDQLQGDVIDATTGFS